MAPSDFGPGTAPADDAVGFTVAVLVSAPTVEIPAVVHSNVLPAPAATSNASGVKMQAGTVEVMLNPVSVVLPVLVTTMRHV